MQMYALLTIWLIRIGQVYRDVTADSVAQSRVRPQCIILQPRGSHQALTTTQTGAGELSTAGQLYKDQTDRTWEIHKTWRRTDGRTGEERKYYTR